MVLLLKAEEMFIEYLSLSCFQNTQEICRKTVTSFLADYIPFYNEHWTFSLSHMHEMDFIF